MKSNLLLIKLIALISIVPVLKANLHPAVLLFFFLLWVLNSVKQTSIGYILNDPWHISKWWILLFSYELVLSVIGFSTCSYHTIITRIPILGLPLIMTFVLRKYSYKEKKNLFVFIAAIIVVTIIQNIILYIQNPSIAEGFTLKLAKYKWTNWGGTTFVASCVFLVPCCYFIWQNKIKGNIRQIALLGLLLPFLYIVSINERATSFILLLFLVISIIYVRKVRIKNNLAFTIITIFAVMAISLLIVPMLNLLSSVLNSEELTVRLSSISSSIQQSEIDESSEGSLYERFYLATVSINTWTKSLFTFLFGIGEDVLDVDSTGHMLDLEALGIGQHSQIIDFLAMYGITGTFVLLKAFHSAFLCIKSLNTDKIINREINAAFICFILMSFLNYTLVADQLFVAFVLFSISINLFSQKEVSSCYVKKNDIVTCHAREQLTL